MNGDIEAEDSSNRTSGGDQPKQARCGGTDMVPSRMLDLGLGDGPEQVYSPCPGCEDCKPAPNADGVDVDPIDFTCMETAMMRLHVEGNRIVRDIEEGDYFVAQGRVRQWLKSIEPYIQRIMERNNDRYTVT